MIRSKYAFVFCGGVAVGGVTASLLWKYCLRENDAHALLKAIGEAKCWPIENAHIFKPSQIHVISEVKDFENMLSDFLNHVNTVKVLGVDCEWTSTKSRSNPVALLQLTSWDYSCYLIRMNKLGGFIPKELLTVLQNKAILKVGVGVLDDASKIFKDHNIIIQGCLDLRAFSARYQLSRAKGLKSLAKELINIDLDKSFSVRCSDWDDDALTDAQIKYAAYDSFVSLKIFEAMLLRKVTKNPLSKKDAYMAAHNAMNDIVKSSVQGLIDSVYKENKSFQSTKCKDLKSCSNNGRKVVGLPKHPKSFKAIKAHSTRQQPLYDNCRLEAPDKQLLSTCDRKKAQWYIDKGLAELVCEEPFTIRLFFEPSGRPDDERDYYLHEKENKCVVCGSCDSYVRKNVVPHEYRRHFALAMKDHTSHDILLLCLACHQRSNYYDSLLRRQLSDEHKAPQGSVQAMRVLEDPERRSVRSAGKALAVAKDKIPVTRRIKLEKVIQDYFQAPELTDEIISKASSLETRIENETYIPHGEKVVTSIFAEKGSQGVLDFEKRWREHFLKTMEPKYLPEMWSVCHNQEKAMRKVKEMDEEYQKKLDTLAAR